LIGLNISSIGLTVEEVYSRPVSLGLTDRGIGLLGVGFLVSLVWAPVVSEARSFYYRRGKGFNPTNSEIVSLVQLRKYDLSGSSSFSFKVTCFGQGSVTYIDIFLFLLFIKILRLATMASDL